MSTSNPPQPSPAPTIGSEFPGLWPKTPTASAADDEPSFAPALDQAASALEQQQHDRQDQLQNAGKAILGAAAGFLVGGPLGALVGGGAAGLSGLELDAIRRRNATNAVNTTTETETGTGEQERPEFGFEAVDKERKALEQSPAQKLVGGDEEEGAKITGEGGLGAALLAGAAGAKVEENEVRSPTTEDDEAERAGGVTEPTLATPPPPDFGTPAIEKEQSSLAHSPAQQLLRSTTSSSVSQAEASLLAGAAGAKLAGKEVEEPAKAPIETLEQKSAEAGAPLGLPGQGEEAHAVPLKREISSLPSPQLAHEEHILSLPARPDLQDAQRPSDSSFAAAVLGAAEGVHTPTETAAGESLGFGSGPRELIATDHEPEDSARATTLAPASSGTDTLATGPNAHPLPPAHVGQAAAVPLPATPAAVEEEKSLAQQDEQEDGVRHNPEPVLPAALAGTAAGAALLGAATERDAPRDFEPYSPPVVEQSPDAKVAAATPLPTTPGVETVEKKSFAPAIIGAGGIYPSSPLAEGTPSALASTETISATVNAQNAKQAQLDTEGTAEPEGSMPIKQALAAGPGLAATPVAGAEPVLAQPSAQDVEPEVFPVRHPPTSEEKGKGKEVLEGAAVGTGVGVVAYEVLKPAEETVAPATAPPAFASQPTSSTIDTLDAAPAALSDQYMDQRAFAPAPHFNRPLAYNTTDEPVLADPHSTDRALDSKLLAAQSVATSPEQAGFAGAAAGAGLTPAMQDITHLSEPSKVAEERALAEAAPAGAMRVAPGVPAEVEKVEQREYVEGSGRDGLPVAAGAATVGVVGAGAGAGLLARDHAAEATLAPPVGAAPASTATPAAVAPVAQQTTTVQQVQTPVSRFTEQTTMTTRPYSPTPTGFDSPSSTRAVQGTPSAPTTPASSVYTGEATPPRTASPARFVPAAPVAPVEDVNLVDAGVVHRSPHMKIQTVEKEGHKRLHRKSLSGSLRRTSLSQPNSPMASGIEYQQAPSGATGAVGAAQRPHLPTIDSERRRERMMDGVVGVRDPTFAAVPSASSAQPAVPSHRSAAPLVPAAGVEQRSVTPPPASGANVGRKLSRRRPNESAPGTPEKKDGFFSRLMHGGSAHKRETSAGSTATSGAAGSPRGSSEASRV
ncbi:hypothetical protein JCM10213_001836 [Rhodosporidiobolus nylandii]